MLTIIYLKGSIYTLTLTITFLILLVCSLQLLFKGTFRSKIEIIFGFLFILKLSVYGTWRENYRCL